MTASIALLKIVAGFAILIGIHELGHAIAAMLCGVKIKSFSLGIGPGLTFKNVPKFNTVTISPIVIGGYVRLDDEALEQKSFLKKFFVYISGMLANVFLAITLLIIYGHSVLHAIFVSLYIWICGIPLSISMLINKAVSVNDAVVGPVGIGHMMASNVIPYIVLLAILNLCIAMFNLLPLPPLDGGKILQCVLEKIIGKTASQYICAVLQVIGIAFLMFLLIFATANDIKKIF